MTEDVLRTLIKDYFPEAMKEWEQEMARDYSLGLMISYDFGYIYERILREEIEKLKKQ